MAQGKIDLLAALNGATPGGREDEQVTIPYSPAALEAIQKQMNGG